MKDHAAPRSLKVLCWNILSTNRDFAGLAGVIEAEAPDICLFQELSDEHVDILRSIPGYRVAIAEDFLEGERMSYLGIVSGTPFSDERVIDHNADGKVSASVAGRYFRWAEHLQSQSVETVIGDTPVRIVNAHLPAAIGPRARARALASLRPHFEDDAHVIFGGDLNSWSTPVLNLTLGWLLGCGPGDWFRRDRHFLESFAAENGFEAVFRDIVSFPRFGLQLDHVFLRGLKCRSARVMKERFGSDHRPLVVEIGIPVAQIRVRGAVAGEQS